MTVNLEQTLVQRLRTLSLERQVEVLDFVDFLSQRAAAATKTRRNPIGLFAGLGIEIGEPDIDRARNELWARFPRDVEL